MSQKLFSRYQPTYRADEIKLIVQLALRGESLGFVGIAGVGKSNIVNFLREIQINAPDIGEAATVVLFPIVDVTHWQRTPESLWQIILDALQWSIRNKFSPLPEEFNFESNVRNEPYNVIREQLLILCQKLGHKVMFVLDDFDSVLENGPLAMLEQLNILRSEGNRGYLSYLVCTKRLPHILGQSYDIESKSKFYDLFRHNIYALGLYTKDDARQMLEHLNELAGNPLPDNQLEQIYQLTGGQARLIRIAFNIWVEGKISGPRIPYFANRPEIQQECHRIFVNLHEHEQEVALRVARGQLITNEDRAIIDHLTLRGLIVKSDPIKWFSPLMEQFLINYQE